MNSNENEKLQLMEYINDREYKLEKAYSLPINELNDQCTQDKLDRLFNGLWVYDGDL